MRPVPHKNLSYTMLGAKENVIAVAGGGGGMSVCQWRVSQDVKGTFTINHRGFHFPQTEALILVSTVGNFIHTLKMRKKTCARTFHTTFVVHLALGLHK